jgi:hypothetical protein
MMCGALLTLGLIGAQRQAAPAFGNNHTRQGKISRVSVIPVVWHAQTSPDGVQPTLSLKIDVDVSHTQAADLNALKNALAGIVPLPDAIKEEIKTEEIRKEEVKAEESGKQAEQSGDARSIPAWFAWGHLNVGRTPAQVAALTGLTDVNVLEALGVYAVHDENGATVCLVNKTNARLLTNTRVRLPRGVYSIERLTISREGGKAEEAQETRDKRQGEGEEQSEIRNPKSKIDFLPPVERLERLEGCDFGTVAKAGKGICLEPGQACLYRYTDVARAARASWFDVFAQLRDMGRNHPGPARRLGTMLHEADGYVAGVRGGGGLQNRLGCIHHLLLVTAQAHSLHHNYQMRHTVNEANGRAVMDALDRLTDALSETSAVLLGLVPQVAVTSLPTAPSNGVDRENGTGKTAAVIASLVAHQKEEKATGAENEKGNVARTVTITLANTGSRSISNVKIGLNAAYLPTAVTCDPADPAYFGDLRPGQTVRATFHVRGAGAQDLPNTLLTGDVSYYAGTAPAHLRPHAW